jgi:hypothetical protein
MADDPSIWPALVSGACSFVGVIAGLGWNAMQAPKTEERLRDNTRAALRTSLWAELTSLAQLMNREIKFIDDNDFTWVPLVESFKIYVANVGNLGLLTDKEVEKVTLAYYRYQENAGYIARMGARSRRKVPGPRIDPDKPAIGRHIEFDWTKPGTQSKDDVKGTLGDIVRESNDAASVLKAELQKSKA